MNLKFYTKKSLGQNFLISDDIAFKISSIINNISEKNILEIGPGFGMLTRSILLQKPKRLFAVEKDERFMTYLSKIKDNNNNFDYKICDALEFDYHENNQAIIANLPYSVATPLILKWIRLPKKIDELVIMVQKEVALRLAAKEGSEHYSRLSIIIQSVYDPYICFDVDSDCFDPKPKVISSVIYMKLNKLNLEDSFLNTLERITASAFAQRRKKISNSLYNVFGDKVHDILKELKINPLKRAQDLSLQEFYAITNFVIASRP